MPDGTNAYRLILREREAVIAEEVLNLTYVPPYPGVQKITAASSATVSYAGSDSNYRGTAMRIPVGAVSKDLYAFIFPSEPQGDEDREFPSVPAKYRQVGPAPVFQPLMKAFLKPVTFVVPFNPELLPEGKSANDVKLLLLGDDGWVEAKGASLAGSSLEYQSSRVHFWAATTAVVDVPAVGDVVVDVERVGAKIYLDNVDMRQIAPSTINGVSPGNHTLRLSKEGFNDLYLSFVQAESHGTYLEGSLTETGSGGPTVTLSSTIPASVTTNALSYIVTGVVTGVSSPELDVKGLVSVNGDERVVPLNPSGAFETYIPLWRAETTVYFRMTDTRTGKTTSSRKVVFRKPSVTSFLPGTSDFMGLRNSGLERQNVEGMDPRERVAFPDFSEEDKFLRRLEKGRFGSLKSGETSLSVARPTERTNDTYIIEHSWAPSLSRRPDMYLRDEYGGRVSRYSDSVYFPGAWYVHGYTIGPDTITLTNPVPGRYTLTIFAATDPGTLSWSRVNVYKNGRLVFSDFRVQSSGESWLAYAFEVRAVKVSGTTLARSVDGELSAKKSPCRVFVGNECDNYVFTTQIGENEIGISALATSSIDPSTIQYRVREVSQYFPPYAPKPIVDVPVVGSGPSAFFRATNIPLVSRTNPRISIPLVYEVVAFVPGGVESAPYYIVQSVSSQIRQEFIDQNGITERPIEIPEQGSLGFDGDSELSAFSDFSERRVLIEGKASTIREVVRNAFTSPTKITSGWRNPRRNSRVNGEFNSIHQYGSAVDFVPAQLQESWGSNDLKGTLHMMKGTIDPVLKTIGCTSRVHDAGSGDHLHVQCR